MNPKSFADEPLDRLARLAWDWAPVLCEPSHGCQDYHRSWSIVRLLELDGSLPAGRAFFERELGELASAGKRRVLVSGGADTGVTALVVSAYRAQGVEPEIVFVDRCRTPALQNELMLRELRIGANIQVRDAAHVECAPVDAVVAHSFIHLLPADKRIEVLAAWARVTRTGARIVMSTALSDHEDDWVRIKDADQVERRRLSLQARARAKGHPAQEAEAIAQTAARFWRTSPGQAPALTEANLRISLDEAGFDLVRVDRHAVDAQKGPISLTTRETSHRERCEIVAVRR